MGTSLRRVGLVGTDKGLFARDVDIEPHDKKRCLVFLTDDPAEVIELLGLDPRYWINFNSSESRISVAPFKDTNELFRTVASMRFFDAGAYVKKDLKGKDKNRIGTRVAYREFIDEFLPTLMVGGKNIASARDRAQAKITQEEEEEEEAVYREQVFDTVLARWDKRKEWLTIKRAWDYDRFDMFTRQIVKETRRIAKSEDDRYIRSWIQWCGYTSTIPYPN